MSTRTVEADRQGRSRLGGRLSAGAAVLGAVAVGAAVDHAVIVAVGVVGALLVAWGAEKLTGDENRERAKGSVGLVAGTATACLSIGLASTFGSADGLVVALASMVAVTTIAVDALVEDPVDAIDPVWGAVSRSGAVLLVAMVPAFFVSTGLLSVGLATTVAVGVAVVSYNTFLSVVVLQLLALGVLFLLDVALPVVDEWRPKGAGEDPVDPLRTFGVHPLEVPKTVWGIVGVQVLLLAIAPGGEWFDATLSLFPVLGDAVQLVVKSGILHLPLVLVAGVASGVLFARGVQRAFVRFAGKKPPRALAYAAGGFVVGALAMVVAAIPDAWIVGAETAQSGLMVNGIATLALAGLVVALVGVVATFGPFGPLSRLPVTSLSPGYTVGVVALFVASMVAAGAGGTPLAVFAGVACSLLAYDLGANATGLRKQLGPDVRTREAELTHATASVVIGVLGVGVAVVALYVVGPGAIAPVEGERATLALVLSVVALVSLAFAVDR